MQNASPIFIVGANRSGTTLLRLILNAHPRIAIPEELNYFNPWIVEQWQTQAPDRNTFRQWVHWWLDEQMPAGAFGTVDLSDVEDEAVTQASTYNWRDLYAGLLHGWARYHGKVRWGEKTPGNLFYVDTLQDMFPDAQFVHLVRDPRAGVLSMQKTSFFGDDVVVNALNRRKYLREGLRRDATMSPEQWTRVRYEDLLTSPEETIRGLCHFLGEEFSPSMLTYYEDAARYMSTAAAQEFNRAARRPIDPSRAYSWRSGLSSTDMSIIEALCRPEMTALGYVSEAPAPSLLNRFLIALKRAYWWLAHRRSDSPDHVVGEPPASYLRRHVSRLLKRVPGLGKVSPDLPPSPS